MKRLIALAKAELLQFVRNKVILFIALLFPLATPLLMWYSFDPQTAEEKQTIGGMTVEVYMSITLLMVLFYSVLSMTTTRRDEGVLKRLRTGEARDVEILVSIAIPGVLVTIVFFAALMVLLLLGGSIPEMFPLTLLALILGLVIYTAAALLTCVYTKNAEAAQLTSLPVFALSFLSMSNIRAALPERIQRIVDMNPFALINDLTILGWNGATQGAGDAAVVTDSTEILTQAGKPAILCLVWICVLVWSVAVEMRWDSHRN